MAQALPKTGTFHRHNPTGRIFLVTDIAREDDLGIDFVILKGLHNGQVWARSGENFNGKRNNEPRFTEVDMDQAQAIPHGAGAGAHSGRGGPKRR